MQDFNGSLKNGDVLVTSLPAANMVDEFKLPIHPLVLGSGRRLAGGAVTTTAGVVIASYRPERQERPQR